MKEKRCKHGMIIDWCAVCGPKDKEAEKRLGKTTGGSRGAIWVGPLDTRPVGGGYEKVFVR